VFCTYEGYKIQIYIRGDIIFTLYLSIFDNKKLLCENKNNIRSIALSHFRAKTENSMNNAEYKDTGDISVINISPYAGIELSSDGRRLANDTNNRIVKGKFGKPFLADGKFSFSVTHSENVYGIVASRVNVGADIQIFDPNRDYMKIAHRWFNPAELEFLASSADKEDTFYEIWTRKEAYAKFTGKGLSSITQIPTVKNGELCDRFPSGAFVSMEKIISPILKDLKFKAKVFVEL